ncbi:unnamed protein product, partial [Symbiodinium sp. KB8]
YSAGGRLQHGAKATSSTAPASKPPVAAAPVCFMSEFSQLALEASTPTEAEEMITQLCADSGLVETSSKLLAKASLRRRFEEDYPTELLVMTSGVIGPQAEAGGKAEVVDDISLCVPAQDSLVTKSDAHFNLGAFGFEAGVQHVCVDALGEKPLDLSDKAYDSLMPTFRMFQPARLGCGHESVAGKIDAQGSFLSQRAAEYPAALAEQYRYAVDKLNSLRAEWRTWLLEKHVPNRKPLWLQSSFKRFSAGLSGSPDWDYTIAEGQPYCLSALQRLSTITADKDTSLFPALLQGVPTGLDDDIPRSHTLRPRREGDEDEGHQLLVCEGNWQGAESDPALLQELIEEELAAGFLEEVDSIEEAYKRWGKDRVAVGRVNIVKAPGRSPRLVVDNSICNTNQNCKVPEQFSLPCLQDIQASYPRREDNEPVSGFSLDVKGAHKTSRVREQDRGIAAHLNDKLVFTSCPPGTSIQPGCTLLSARHVDLKCPADLHKVPGSSKRIWMRVSDPSSSRRKLSSASRETLEFFLYLSSREWQPRPLRPPPLASVESAADAFGKGDDCGVGGWLKLAGGQTAWFSHRYTVSDFTSLGLPLQSNANLDISSYETLAQCFVLICFWKISGSGRLAVSLPALSDNTGAESVCNRLYTSKVPLNLFVKKLSMWSSMTGIQLECSHISGEKNDDADLLSRWDGQSELPDRFLSESRVHISLSDFWYIRFAVTLHPKDAFLKWRFPEPHQLGPSNRGRKREFPKLIAEEMDAFQWQRNSARLRISVCDLTSLSPARDENAGSLLVRGCTHSMRGSHEADDGVDLTNTHRVSIQDLQCETGLAQQCGPASDEASRLSCFESGNLCLPSTPCTTKPGFTANCAQFIDEAPCSEQVACVYKAAQLRVSYGCSAVGGNNAADLLCTGFATKRQCEAQLICQWTFNSAAATSPCGDSGSPAGCVGASDEMRGLCHNQDEEPCKGTTRCRWDDSCVCNADHFGSQCEEPVAVFQSHNGLGYDYADIPMCKGILYAAQFRCDAVDSFADCQAWRDVKHIPGLMRSAEIGDLILDGVAVLVGLMLAACFPVEAALLVMIVSFIGDIVLESIVVHFVGQAADIVERLANSYCFSQGDGYKSIIKLQETADSIRVWFGVNIAGACFGGISDIMGQVCGKNWIALAFLAAFVELGAGLYNYFSNTVEFVDELEAIERAALNIQPLESGFVCFTRNPLLPTASAAGIEWVQMELLVVLPGAVILCCFCCWGHFLAALSCLKSKRKHREPDVPEI